MNSPALSLRPFIGSLNFEVSRAFYKAIGFEENAVLPNMSVFSKDRSAFYLQRYYVKEWVDNTMLFLEVADVPECWRSLDAMKLPETFPGARLDPIRHEEWGHAFALIDPSGVLWHVGAFRKDD
ncbi:MAG: glyoxalase [Chitinophagaceae bacterium]|nr:MAG: glyoxalase [Chitinophagaceae bacterium]